MNFTIQWVLADQVALLVVFSLTFITAFLASLRCEHKLVKGGK